MQRRVPDVSRVAGKERPRGAPIAVVVRDLADSQTADQRTIGAVDAVAPASVVASPVERVGHHQMRRSPVQDLGDDVGLGAVAACKAVIAEQPDITRFANYL